MRSMRPVNSARIPTVPVRAISRGACRRAAYRAALHQRQHVLDAWPRHHVDEPGVYEFTLERQLHDLVEGRVARAVDKRCDEHPIACSE